MKALKTLLVLMLTIQTVSLMGQQRETFDMVSFQVPSGWKREASNSGVSYTIVNNQTGDWCIISVYKSIGSSGNLTTDFDHEWDQFVTRVYENTVKPRPELMTQGGWSVQSGTANFTWQNKPSLILLNVISGYGKTSSITVTTNTRAYQSEAEQFLDSIEMQKSVDGLSSSPVTQQPAQANNSGSGISKITTHFNDGWTAVAKADGIEVTKGATTYFSFFGVPSYSTGGERGTTQYYWDKHVSPYCTITNLWLNPDVQSIGYNNCYAEGMGTEKATGKSVYIGFRVIAESGVDFCTMAVSPSKEEYLAHFPSMDDLKAMRNSNRFAVTLEDILGDWSSSSSSALQYYNVYTGQSAGMQFSQGGQEFFFRSNGDYNANISGAMGTMGGAQVAFDNKYKGKFSVTDWEITMTGYGGITQVFTAYFEALQGGRILHIAKKDAPGVHYPLVKIK